MHIRYSEVSLNEVRINIIVPFLNYFILQGNGHERDFIGMPNVYVMDAYNSQIYPKDQFAKGGIQLALEFSPFTSDYEYLELIETHLEMALREFHPDIIVYNAGTDILEGDRLGRLSVSPSVSLFSLFNT